MVRLLLFYYFRLFTIRLNRVLVLTLKANFQLTNKSVDVHFVTLMKTSVYYHQYDPLVSPQCKCSAQ